MKRICAFFLVFAIPFAFSACDSATPDSPVLEFSGCMRVDAEYTDGKFPLEAQVTSALQGVTVIKVTTPDELSGLQYKWLDGFEMSYNGLCCKTEEVYLPDYSFSQAVYGVLCDLPQNGVLKSFKDGKALYTGECPCGKYSVITDKKGNIRNISVKEINLSADFTCQQ